MVIQESQQQSVNQHKGHRPQPQAGEHGQSSQLLGNANGEGIANTCSESAARRQQAHANAGEAVPAQIDSQSHNQGNQRHALLKGADERAQAHKEQHHHSHQAVTDSAEAICGLAQNIGHQAALVQGGEDAADDQQEQDHGDEGAAAGGAQHEDRGEQPFPEGDTALGKGKAHIGVKDPIAAGIFHTGIHAARDGQGQQIGYHHQAEDHSDGSDK